MLYLTIKFSLSTPLVFEFHPGMRFHLSYTRREKCPNTEFFLVRIFLCSFQIQENKDQEKLRIWILLTQ